MDWMEQNIDASRVMAEILRDFRALFRQTLETIHGSDWFETGIPNPTFCYRRFLDTTGGLPDMESE